jgi:hypothetical protein
MSGPRHAVIMEQTRLTPAGSPTADPKLHQALAVKVDERAAAAAASEAPLARLSTWPYDCAEATVGSPSPARS